MTLAHDPELVRAQQQLAAIEAFTRSRREAAEALELAEANREARLDAARRLEVLRTEQAALVARTHEQLRASGQARPDPVVRAVVGQHHPWFAERVVGLLQDAGVEVVARSDNGAEVIGVSVAEQPELLLVEDPLLMVPGEEVVREVRRYCPEAVIAALVPTSARIEPLLDAGASLVHTKQVRPAEVVAGALQLVRQ